jgi:hypothetical protein
LALFAGFALLLTEFPSDAAAGTVDPEIRWKLGFIYGPSLLLFYFLALGAISIYEITRAGYNNRVEKLAAREGGVTDC